MKVRTFANAHEKAAIADFTLFTLGVPSNESWTIKGFKIESQINLNGELYILINGNETYKTSNLPAGAFVTINQEHPPGTRIDVVLHKMQAAPADYVALLAVEVNYV